MAKRLQDIYGTEEDKVNCPFYYKIGACRHGDTCTRLHNKPHLSQTILFRHLYTNPEAAIAYADGRKVPKEKLVEAVNHFEDFYEEVFIELAKFGELADLVVADNIGDHMVGNVYAKFHDEECAEKAMKGQTGRYYCGKLIQAEYSPVTDFREAKCRQYKEGTCERGGFCNFMHPKPVERQFKKQLYDWMYEKFPLYKEDRRKRKEEEEERGKEERRRSKSPSVQPQPAFEQGSRLKTGRTSTGHRRDFEDADYDRRDGGRKYRGDDVRSGRPEPRGGEYSSRRDFRDDDRYNNSRRSDRDRDRDRDRERDRDRDRERERDRGGRHVSRSRSRSRGREERERYPAGSGPAGASHRDEDNGKRMLRMSSAERRAMIAGWGSDEDDAKPVQARQEEARVD